MSCFHASRLVIGHKKSPAAAGDFLLFDRSNFNLAVFLAVTVFFVNTLL